MAKKPTSLPAQTQRKHPGAEHKMKPEPEVILKGYQGSGKLRDKVALISGGDSGIGRAVAVHFAREGADVAVMYFSNEQDAEDTKEMVEKEGARCHLIQGDIGDEKFCQRAVKQVIKEFGQLNILVNNAAEQ